MDQTEFASHRVLVLGTKTHNIQILRSILAMVGVGRIVQVEDGATAARMLCMEHYQAIFCELDAEAQLAFVRMARRREGMLNPMIPIFLLQSQVRHRHLEKARDCGATDLLTIPVSPRTVAGKLRTATKMPRAFIVGQDFFGPDRRARIRASYIGPDRRKKSPKKTRVDLVHI